MKLCFLTIFSVLVFSSCVQKEKERKAVPPPSNASKIPWNSMNKGEGSGMFGGMLDKR